MLGPKDQCFCFLLFFFSFCFLLSKLEQQKKIECHMWQSLLIYTSAFFGISSWIICFKKNGDIFFCLGFFLRPHWNEHVNKFRYIMSFHRILYSFCWFLIDILPYIRACVARFPICVVKWTCMRNDSIGWHLFCILHLYEGCSPNYNFKKIIHGK